MQPLLKPHPAIVAFLLAMGLLITGAGCYLLMASVPAPTRSEMDSDVILALKWALLATGLAMWFAGGIVFGKGCGLNWFVSLLLHFLPLLGLIVMRWTARHRISKGVWALKYRGVEDRVSRRAHRDLKALY